MRKGFILGHWLLTLLLAPLVSQIITFIMETNTTEVAGLLEVYPVSFFFSLLFSLPTFAIYIVAFNFLANQEINLVASKFVLNLISVLGVFITMRIITGSMSKDIIIAYSTTSIIIGIILRLRKKDPKINENPLPT